MPCQALCFAKSLASFKICSYQKRYQVPGERKELTIHPKIPKRHNHRKNIIGTIEFSLREIIHFADARRFGEAQPEQPRWLLKWTTFSLVHEITTSWCDLNTVVALCNSHRNNRKRITLGRGHLQPRSTPQPG